MKISDMQRDPQYTTVAQFALCISSLHAASEEHNGDLAVWAARDEVRTFQTHARVYLPSRRFCLR